MDAGSARGVLDVLDALRQHRQVGPHVNGAFATQAAATPGAGRRQRKLLVPAAAQALPKLRTVVLKGSKGGDDRLSLNGAAGGAPAGNVAAEGGGGGGGAGGGAAGGGGNAPQAQAPGLAAIMAMGLIQVRQALWCWPRGPSA